MKTKKITRFTDDYYFLSNFYPRLIKHEGLTFQSVEAAFQSLKCRDLEESKTFQMLSPADAKKKGRSVELRPDWEDNKLRYMFLLVLLKFQSQPDLQKKLLATGDTELIEGNNWHDNFWGDCECTRCQNITGQNHLGQILMRVRDNLRAETANELRVTLPDGTILCADANRTDEYPSIHIKLIKDDKTIETICFAEHNPYKPVGKELCIGVYNAVKDEPVYYESYVKGRRQ
jgi:hypothetical protein